MKILAVDDDQASLETIASALARKGHEVVTARNGEEAAYILFKNSIRMVVTDRTMPGMDGLELCRWIRSRGFHSYVFVIMLTERAETADIIEGLTAGADEFLSKPIDRTELDLRVSTGERILSNEYHQITIFTLAKLAESRDPETGLHLDRIREYSKILGVNLARQDKYRDILPFSEIENIYYTSVLHDIGKVGIPDTILLKPGPLDPAEFDIMKTHTIIGGKTLGQALAEYPEARFLEVARNIAFWHHERFDGTTSPSARGSSRSPTCTTPSRRNVRTRRRTRTRRRARSFSKSGINTSIRTSSTRSSNRTPSSPISRRASPPSSRRRLPKRRPSLRANAEAPVRSGTPAARFNPPA
jgi:putative two-component system response regulator